MSDMIQIKGLNKYFGDLHVLKDVNLNVKAGENVKQGQLLGVCSKTVVAEMRIGTVPINPLLVWRGQCDGLKNY